MGTYIPVAHQENEAALQQEAPIKFRTSGCKQPGYDTV